MRRERQQRRLKIPPAPSKGARRETDNEFRCDEDAARVGD
jgi:hypothetical protein